MTFESLAFGGNDGGLPDVHLKEGRPDSRADNKPAEQHRHSIIL